MEDTGLSWRNSFKGGVIYESAGLSSRSALIRPAKLETRLLEIVILPFGFVYPDRRPIDY
jgi:hypothetical protein